MITNLSEQNSIFSNWINEIRDVEVQGDRLRFRKNMERIGEVAAYEISKTLDYRPTTIQTPLGEVSSNELSEQPILATILRAGLPLHQGILNYFDKADCAFIAAYRKHHRDGSFEIEQQYITCPDISNRILIIADPMLATGASLSIALQALMEENKPKTIHIVCAISSTEGIEFIKRKHPEANIWTGAIDDELTAKGYIVPGLGDAGDLSFGLKQQS